jgi:hypothetical protein
MLRLHRREVKRLVQIPGRPPDSEVDKRSEEMNGFLIALLFGCALACGREECNSV